MKSGATLSFGLSEAAAVRLTVLKRIHGRFTPVSASTPLAAPAGHNARRFCRRLAGEALKPGRHRLVAIDTSGNTAAPVTLDFIVSH